MASAPAQKPQASGFSLKHGSGTFLSGTVRYTGGQYDDDLQTRRLPDALMVTAGSIPGFSIGWSPAPNLFDAEIVSSLTATGIKDLGTPRTFWVGSGLGL